MKPIVWFLAAALPNAALADPLVTVTCDPPKGVTQEYGVGMAERIDADLKEKPQPAPSFKGPIADGYQNKPTFIVDSSKQKVTVVWAESAADIKLREDAKKVGAELSPPPPATEMPIVAYSPTAIIAAEISPYPGGALIYSLFPNLGVLFMSSQYINPEGQNASLTSVFAKCQFSWSALGR